MVSTPVLNKAISKAVVDDIVEATKILLPEDLREIRDGLGVNPSLSILHDILSTDSISFRAKDGRLMGLAGVSDDGCIWMHCTSVVKEYPVTFARGARGWIDSLSHPILYNCADTRNAMHLKLLKHLGFRFLRVVPYGPNNLYFVEFVRLWHSHSQL